MKKEQIAFKENDWVVVMGSDKNYLNAEKDAAQKVTRVNDKLETTQYELVDSKGGYNLFEILRLATPEEIEATKPVEVPEKPFTKIPLSNRIVVKEVVIPSKKSVIEIPEDLKKKMEPTRLHLYEVVAVGYGVGVTVPGLTFIPKIGDHLLMFENAREADIVDMETFKQYFIYNERNIILQDN